MPIMAAHDQNDARGSARVLAATVRKCLEEDYAPSKHKSAFNNLFRLLEAYRAHRFVGFDVVELRTALDHAFASVYRGSARDEAVDSVENVLRSIAYPKIGAQVAVDRERVSAFLKSFIQHLYPKGTIL